MRLRRRTAALILMVAALLALYLARPQPPDLLAHAQIVAGVRAEQTSGWHSCFWESDHVALLSTGHSWSRFDLNTGVETVLPPGGPPLDGQPDARFADISPDRKWKLYTTRTNPATWTVVSMDGRNRRSWMGSWLGTMFWQRDGKSILIYSWKNGDCTVTSVNVDRTNQHTFPPLEADKLEPFCCTGPGRVLSSTSRASQVFKNMVRVPPVFEVSLGPPTAIVRSLCGSDEAVALLLDCARRRAAARGCTRLEVHRHDTADTGAPFTVDEGWQVGPGIYHRPVIT